MSILPMLRKCQYCNHKYPYNPSTGNFGLVCPKCSKPQSGILPSLQDKIVKK